MIWGMGTLGGVAIRIAEDYRYYEMENHHTVKQAIERVCTREQTLASAGASPSYVWLTFEIEDGDITLVPDRGKLKSLPRLKKSPKGKKYRYVALDEADAHDLIPAEFKTSSYISYRELPLVPLRMGLGIGQKILVRFREEWHTDYWGESDCSQECEVLYVEPGPFPLCLDSGLTARPQMTGLRVA